MKKTALLIGMSEYQPGLSPLPGAVRDMAAMQRVLQHPDMGGFDEVKILANPDVQQMQEAIEALFSSCVKEDLTLLFFSGHGIKDDRGRLYFATPLTRKNSNGDLVKATAVPASFVQDIMSQSRCNRQVVILDCCFSGAFAEGMTAKDDGVVDVQSQLGGEGRAVLTSSTSTQYSFEEQGAELSVYTRFIVEGIETGIADTDNDGFIAVDELHDYARKKVQDTSPAMKPKIYAVEEGFRIFLAKAPTSDPRVIYRKEVERFFSRGTISAIGRNTLDVRQATLGLLPEVAAAIEAEVMKPYQEYQAKLLRYEQVLVAELQRQRATSQIPQASLPNTTLGELQSFQKALGLRKEDVEAIAQRLLQPKHQDVLPPPPQDIPPSVPKNLT
ncbi:MAG: caspase family protein, partial [Cyanobacteria bacterium CAN_BIN43]|nr:caspase family protein [Cyanobacteria bacterium CAN_BIN43]